uniref:MIP18 family protein CG7949-like n=1 Tax=Hirondellea gigas TaxID=1518452 RepID=A0A2P2HXL1_9CRUS
MAGTAQLDNLNPTLFSTASQRFCSTADWDDDVYDPVDEREIFDMVRDIQDPEHPLTLEQLNVVSESLCSVDDAKGEVRVQFTPTIPHCSMAALIGLSIRFKLLRSLPSRFKVRVLITPGSHASEEAVNKQLADKERVAAALENPHLLAVINKCLAGVQ